jgi:hypothetical protein
MLERAAKPIRKSRFFCRGNLLDRERHRRCRHVGNGINQLVSIRRRAMPAPDVGLVLMVAGI